MKHRETTFLTSMYSDKRKVKKKVLRMIQRHWVSIVLIRFILNSTGQNETQVNSVFSSLERSIRWWPTSWSIECNMNGTIDLHIICVTRGRVQEFSKYGQKLLETQKFSGQDLGKAAFSKHSAEKKRPSKILNGQLPICPSLGYAPVCYREEHISSHTSLYFLWLFDSFTFSLFCGTITPFLSSLCIQFCCCFLLGIKNSS